MSGPVRIEPVFLEKIWGSTRLEPWFAAGSRKIGEVWFPCEREIPLLVKFIFTEEALSVQVHPGDEFARAHENSAGKTEMWHILRADPGARLALGFREPLSPRRMREAALSGEIEQLLNWIDVAPGQTYLVEAGTVHAIGGGLALCEIQQFSDVTYRLYDYGRPRELHLDKAIQVAQAVAHSGARQPVPAGDGWVLLAESRYFRTEARAIDATYEYRALPDRAQMLIIVEGSGHIASEGFAAGEAWLIPAGMQAVPITAETTARVLRTYVPV